MTPKNFPEKKNQRRTRALQRLVSKEPKAEEEQAILKTRITKSARDFRSKKYRGS